MFLFLNVQKMLQIRFVALVMVYNSAIYHFQTFIGCKLNIDFCFVAMLLFTNLHKNNFKKLQFFTIKFSGTLYKMLLMMFPS
jgi:hypothetical protein